MNFSKIIYIGLGLGIVAALLTILGLSSKIKNLNNDLSYKTENLKALFSERDSLSNTTRVLHLTIEELNYINDSIIVKMNETKNELRIKDKNIQQLEYQLSKASRTDTIIFRDTLFRDPDLKIDTLINDRWYKLSLGLEYPSTISVSPTFISERFTTMYLKKETIKPPKKSKFLRFFQKKHKVMVVDVKEENPYIDIKEQRYIQIMD